MDLVATAAYLVIYSIALLVLISLGLAVIFGMMKVINLAHGEFLMLGAYVVRVRRYMLARRCGSAIGVEHRRGRRCSASWSNGSLSVSSTGASSTRCSPPGAFPCFWSALSPPSSARRAKRSDELRQRRFGGINLSSYNLILIAITVRRGLVLTWVLARFTTFGLIVRGTMQDPDMAARSASIET